MENKISTLILTYNSSDTIEKCIKSVLWTDEIIIIDSYSKDSTINIAAKYGCKIYSIERKRWPDLVKFGLTKTNNDWVLFIDSDEEVSEELAKEIQKLFYENKLNTGGYDIKRQVYFNGKWLNFGEWNNDYQHRLFNKNFIYVNDLEVHGTFSPKGFKSRLENKIFHYTYRNIFDFVERFNWYSSLDVTIKLQNSPDKKVRWYNFILNPLADFLKVYISKKGFKDGLHGFLLAVFSSMHKFCTYAKLWEYIYCKEHNLARPPINYNDLTKFIRRT